MSIELAKSIYIRDDQAECVRQCLIHVRSQARVNASSVYIDGLCRRELVRSLNAIIPLFETEASSATGDKGHTDVAEAG